MNRRRLFVVAEAVMWVACFVWALVAPSWWAVCAVLALWWLSFTHHDRADARQAAAQQSLLVDREVRGSLTDESLAWAVGTWRKRYL